MAETQKYHVITLFCAVTAILIGVTALIGVCCRGDMGAKEVVSVRGETYRMVNEGIYKYNSERIVAEGIGWDIFTLFVALPVFLALLPFIWRGSIRGRLLGVGLLAYFFYQYLMYSLAWAFSSLFMIFITLYAGSLCLAIWMATTIDISELRQRIEFNFPKYGVIAFCILISLMLIGMWSQRICAGLNGDWETAMLLGQTTMVIQALDLGLVVPFALITAFLVLKNQPIGFLFAPILMVKGASMAGAICVMAAFAWIVEGKSQLADLVLFLSVFFVTLYLGYRMLRSV